MGGWESHDGAPPCCCPRRRLAGLLTTCGLPLSAGPARAEPGVRASFELTPGPAEWWLAAWQVQRKVWPLTEGAGVTVGEVESGVQATIPDLRGVVLPGADLTGTGGNGDTDIQVGEDGHGTAMAVVIAGQGAGTGTVGIAPRSRILPVIVGGSGPASVRTAAAGIRYAVSHGAQVINLPFGIGRTSPAACDPVLQAAVAYALGHDVVLVASSGNASLYAGPGEPASCAGVLAVGGTEPDGSLWRGSTRQPYVAVARARGPHGLRGARRPVHHHGSGDELLRRADRGHGRADQVPLSGHALVSGGPAADRHRHPGRPPGAEPGLRLRDHQSGPGGERLRLSRPRLGPQPGLREVHQAGWPPRRAGRRPRGTGSAPGNRPPPRPGQPGATPCPCAAITMREIVITAAAAVCAFVTALVFVLRMSSRRRRLAAMAAQPQPRRRRHWDERSWSFGPDEGGDYGGSPGYGRPPGYGPPPLWTEPPYDPPRP